MSGGDTVVVQPEDFDQGYEYEQLRLDSPSIGAIATFTGLVREFSQHPQPSSLFLETYPAMVELTLGNIIVDARKRWPIYQVRIIHRIGKLQAGDQIVFVGVNSAHRRAAFESCEFIMDFLKTEAPFWKKEISAEGEQWVDAKESDQQAKVRWQQDV